MIDESRLITHFALQRGLKGDTFLVVHLQGDLDIATVPRFRDALLPLTMQPGDESAVILDFAKLDFIDSSGLGAIIVLYRNLTAKQRRLCFVAPARQVLRSLCLLQFDQFIPVYQSVEEAIASLGE